MRTRTTALLAGLGLLLLAGGGASPVAAQGYFDQYAIEDILARNVENLDDLPEVYYEYAVLNDPSGNSVVARNR